MPPNAEDFQKELDKIFTQLPFIDIRSGDLHKKVGDYPGTNHRMRVCCEVMRKNMKQGDIILKQPPKGNGANLIIRYKLPR